MATHNETGQQGEQLAAAWLTNAGYSLLHQNWRHSHWEVDIIAHKNDVLHFIEVKTLKSSRYGNPEQKVGKQKMQHLANAAQEYLYQQPQWKRIQFDILAITLLKTKTEYFLVQDVYW